MTDNEIIDAYSIGVRDSNTVWLTVHRKYLQQICTDPIDGDSEFVTIERARLAEICGVSLPDDEVLFGSPDVTKLPGDRVVKGGDRFVVEPDPEPESEDDVE